MKELNFTELERFPILVPHFAIEASRDVAETRVDKKSSLRTFLTWPRKT